MEFLEVLALAKKKQLKYDNEVKKIEERIKQKEIDRKKQLLTSFKFNHKPIRFNDVNSNNKLNENSLCSNNKSNVKKSLKTPTNKTTNIKTNLEEHQKPWKSVSQKCELKPTIAKKKSKSLSFAEMLELAKKNVHDCSDQKRPFEDLIPCSLKSKYRKLDKLEPDLSKSNFKDNVNLCSTTAKKDASDVNKLSNRSKETNVSDSIEKHSADTSVNKSDKQNYSKKSIQSKLIPCKNKILDQFQGIRSSELQTSTNYSQVRKQSTEIKKSQNDDNLKKINSANIISNKFSSSKHTNDTLIKNKPKISNLYSNKHNDGKTSYKSDNINKKIESKKIYEKTSCPNDVNVHRTNINNRIMPFKGIAAQFGLTQNSVSVQPHNNYSDDEDYASDDSFIDDSEVIQSKEYARMVQDIHKSLHFDPRKYGEVNSWENLGSMESKYRDIEKEERVSARLAAVEDGQELLLDMKRKREKVNSRRSR